MALVNTDVKQYGINYQEYLLSQVLSNPDIFVRCKGILKPDYFDKEFHNSISFVHEHSQKYNTTPTLDDIEFKGGYRYRQTPVDSLGEQAVLDDVGQFCRHKALAIAIQQGMELVNQKKYGGIEELIREAMLVTVQNELGLDVYENPEDVIRSLNSNQGSFKTGWETLDFKLQGGFGRQELEIFAAASGGGKSVVLQNLAVNFSKQGKVGAYISLELAEELVAVRIYSMMVNKKNQEIKASPENAGIQIKLEEKTSGSLRIKRLPESVSTVNDIESYLRELQIKTGEKLDYVCVDYLDLLTSDRCGPNDKSNAFVKDKFVSEELRALAMKMDITVITACQFNRSGISEDKKSQSQIAGGISKIYTADNVIYIEARRETGEMWFDFQKTRNSGAVGSRLRMSYNTDSLRVLDHAITVQQMEIEPYGFKHTNPANIGGGNVVGAPGAAQVQTPMQMLHSHFQATQSVSTTSPDAPVSQSPGIQDNSNSTSINTTNDASKNNESMLAIRSLLNRK
jgi:Replicative DNA helicase